MNSETRQCQNCKQNFVIDPEDFAFYERIKVPPPTWCPECRQKRRMMFRNERTLYRRKCNATDHTEDIVSIYSIDKPFIVYDQKFWWSDKWDPLRYGKDYDFSRPFFTQFSELLASNPLLAVFNGNAVQSEYCNHAFDSKECYLIFGAIYNERVLYSNRVARCKDSVDLYMTTEGEICYNISNCVKSSRLFFSSHCEGCFDSYFLYDCHNCSNCFGCTNLRSKQYHIFNESYSKEEYEKKLQEFNLGSFRNFLQSEEKFNELYSRSIHKYADMLKSVDVIGDNIRNSKNCFYCFDIFEVEDCKYSIWGGYRMKDSYDGYGAGIAELLYETVDTGGVAGASSRNYFTVVSWDSLNVQYSYNCHSCSNLFGCIGLRNKQYCILNKQYTKEEYEKLVPKIIQHMNDMPYVDKKGRVYKYGEFFPPELSPFAYNETIAQEYFPLTKDQALAQGYSWKDPEERNYQITKKTADLPDHIKDVPDSITQEIIQCAHTKNYRGSTSIDCNEQCTTAFKIIPEELAFYRRMNLPLPRLCPNCRHYQRLKQRNPLKLWHRKCQCAGNKSENSIYTNTISHFHKDNHCPNEFETSYAPERKEIVYCEQCYNAEVV